jgi:hypothetical protein
VIVFSSGLRSRYIQTKSTSLFELPPQIVFPYLRVLSQGITAQVRYFHDCDNDKLGGNYYTMPLNFLTYYPQDQDSNDGLAKYKLGVLGYRVRFLQVSDINDHIVDIANSLIP